ncbi:MAG: hypothetical protein AAGG56_18010, partial [Pseudomonadota bacterium]
KLNLLIKRAGSQLSEDLIVSENTLEDTDLRGVSSEQIEKIADTRHVLEYRRTCALFNKIREKINIYEAKLKAEARRTQISLFRSPSEIDKQDDDDW